METYTMFEAATRFGVEVIERLKAMDRQPVKNLMEDKNIAFFDEYKTDEINIKNVGRLCLRVFQPKDGAPEREYVELTNI